MARWTSDYDCEEETDWWYVIKDDVYDISALKSKRRNIINKGRANFEIRVINPADYAEELFNVQVLSFEAYPKRNRPTINKESYFKSVSQLKGTFFGAFLISDNENANKLCGYSWLRQKGECIYFIEQKTIPEYEKLQLNAALVDGLLLYFNEVLKSKAYICDGQRNINHETAFQDYLIKYFAFRRAYCKVHIAYHPKIKWLIKAIYPFRGVLKRLDNIGLVHSVNAILKMEAIVRNQK